MAYEQGSGQSSSKTTTLASLVSTSKKKTTTKSSFDKALEEYKAWYRGDSSQKTNARSTSSSKASASNVSNGRYVGPTPTRDNRYSTPTVSLTGAPNVSVKKSGSSSSRSSSNSRSTPAQQSSSSQGGYRASRSGSSGSGSTTRKYNESYPDPGYRPANPFTSPAAVPRVLPSSEEVFGEGPNPWKRDLDMRSTFMRHATRLPSPMDAPVYPERREVWRPSRMGQPQPLSGPMSVPAPPVSPLRRSFPQEVGTPIAPAAPPSVARPGAPRMQRTMNDEISDYVRSQVYLPYAPMGRWR